MAASLGEGGETPERAGLTVDVSVCWVGGGFTAFCYELPLKALIQGPRRAFSRHCVPYDG